MGEDLAAIDRLLGEARLEDARVHQLLTIARVNATVAIGLLAAITDITRFRSPENWIYFALNPERAFAEQAERIYARFVARWRGQEHGVANPTRTP